MKHNTYCRRYVPMSEWLRLWFRTHRNAANEVARLLHFSQLTLEKQISGQHWILAWRERQIIAVLDLGILPEYYN